MTVPDEVREALYAAVAERDEVRHEWDAAQAAVDTVLAHLEQVGWECEESSEVGLPCKHRSCPNPPVYRIRTP